MIRNALEVTATVFTLSARSARPQYFDSDLIHQLVDEARGALYFQTYPIFVLSFFHRIRGGVWATTAGDEILFLPLMSGSWSQTPALV